MLEIKNLTKIYEGGTLALDDVSFDVPQGQFVSVIGVKKDVGIVVKAVFFQGFHNSPDLLIGGQDAIVVMCDFFTNEIDVRIIRGYCH